VVRRTFASGTGGMGFKSRVNQISHRLPSPPLQPLKCGPCRKIEEMDTDHSWHLKGN